MRVYHERLTVPLTWWVLGLTMLAILGAELNVLLIAYLPGWRGWLASAGVYLVFGGLYCAMLASWGRARITVAGGCLNAGPARAPLAAVEEVAALDQTQTRALRGPRADPAARMLTRPYLRESVYVRLREPIDGAPYWLLGSRRPAELAAAVEQARTGLRPGGAGVG